MTTHLYTIHAFEGPRVSAHNDLRAAIASLSRGQCVIHEGRVAAWHHENGKDDRRIATSWLQRARVLPASASADAPITCAEPGCTAGIPPHTKAGNVYGDLCALHRARAQTAAAHARAAAKIAERKGRVLAEKADRLAARAAQVAATFASPVARSNAMRGAIVAMVAGDHPGLAAIRRKHSATRAA